MRLVLAVLLACLAWSAAAQQAAYPLKADDGTMVANHRVPVETWREIERLPGAVVAGNPEGDVTLAEFYDLNCPYCRKAAADVSALLKEDSNLRILLVPFPVLGIQSILAGRVELAVAQLGTAEQFWEFHRRIFAGRGVIDGDGALAVARELGFSDENLIPVANDNATTEVMKAHVRLGNTLGLQATPAFVINDIAILGHPGRKSLQAVIAAVRRCKKVMC